MIRIFVVRMKDRYQKCAQRRYAFAHSDLNLCWALMSKDTFYYPEHIMELQYISCLSLQRHSFNTNCQTDERKIYCCCSEKVFSNFMGNKMPTKLLFCRRKRLSRNGRNIQRKTVCKVHRYYICLTCHSQAIH